MFLAKDLPAEHYRNPQVFEKYRNDSMFERYRHECLLDRTEGGKLARSVLSPSSYDFWSTFRLLSYRVQSGNVVVTSQAFKSWEQLAPAEKVNYDRHMDKAANYYFAIGSLPKWEAEHPEHSDMEATLRCLDEHKAQLAAKAAAEAAEAAMWKQRRADWEASTATRAQPRVAA